MLAPQPKNGRPRHEPTEAARKQVEALAGFGITEPEIGTLVGITPPTLRKWYRQELDIGHVKANSAVAQSLYKKALGEGPSSVTAAIFWLKTRAGWKETQSVEHTVATPLAELMARIATAGQKLVKIDDDGDAQP